jgi:hypothetical protein
MRRLLDRSHHRHTTTCCTYNFDDPFATSLDVFFTMPRYLTFAFLIIAIFLASQNQSISPIQDYMLRLKNFLAPFTTSAASNMVHSKPAPAPTVQTAIKEKESLTAGEGGQSRGLEGVTSTVDR